MRYGLQLYSVRDAAERDLLKALRQVAALGYGEVEFAGYFGRSATDVKRCLDELGLAACGTHTGLGELLAHTDETVAYHHAIGCKRIVIPWAELDTREKLSAFVRNVNALLPRLAADGIALGYHNHADEFRENADGSRPFETLMDETALLLELDTFWAYAAGRDPVALMTLYRDRLPVIHLKDGLADGEGKPLGQGTAPVAAVWKQAIALGCDVVVESETLTPDGMTEARVCLEYLRQLA